MPRVCLLLVVVLIVGGGCKENFFESIVEVEIPEHQPQMAISAHFNEILDANYPVFINNSLGILDSQNIQPIFDAKVELYEDNNLVAVHAERRRAQFDKIPFQKGVKYQLLIEHEKYGTAIAEQIAPTKVPILRATYNERQAVDRFGDKGEEVSITFQDPAGERNFYEIMVLADIERVLADSSALAVNVLLLGSPIDPIITEAMRKQLFTDATFDGQEYTIKFVLFIEEEINDNEILNIKQLKIYFLSTTQDHHSYWTSLQTHFDNRDNIFAEPTNVFENMEGGIGIFTIGTGDEFVVDF